MNGMVYGSNSGYEMPSSMWQPESWDGSLGDSLVGGERQEAASGVMDMSWNVGPSRVQESAERARIIVPDEQLVQRLQVSYPVGLHYHWQSSADCPGSRYQPRIGCGCH